MRLRLSFFSSEHKAATHLFPHLHTHTLPLSQAKTHFLPKNRSPLKVLVVCGQGWTAGVEVDRSEQDDDADPGVACSLPSTRASRLADISPRSPSPSIMGSKGKHFCPGRDIPSHTHTKNMILYTCKDIQWGETSDKQVKRKSLFLCCYRKYPRRVSGSITAWLISMVFEFIPSSSSGNQLTYSSIPGSAAV